MPRGIRDKVAIIGMGCTKFGERWDASAEDLMVEAFVECLQDAKIEKNDIQAGWLGTFYQDFHVGISAVPLSKTLNLPHIPVTRVENMCCTGTEAFRGASYAVASGAADICLALGVEKLKDVGYGGLPGSGSQLTLLNMTGSSGSGPGMFAQLASAYRSKYNVSREDLKKAIAHVSWKSHQNGAKNPKAHLRRPVTMEQILNAPIIADPLGLFDCCGVSDGAACAIVTTPEIARRLGHEDPILVKSLQISASSHESGFNEWDGSHVIPAEKAAVLAYEEAGIKNPRKEISMFEVHDCFSITEMVIMEDLHFSERGQGWKDVLDGFYDFDGGVPCQVDGGLKCFGHPIGASGLRMLYEMYLQLKGRAGERQLHDPKFGLTHNLGGSPPESVNAVAIIGRS